MAFGLAAAVNVLGLIEWVFVLPKIEPPHIARGNGLQVASLIDIAGTKASVLQMRAEAKDYIDIDALSRLGNISLPTALAAGIKLYGSPFNPENTLKALSYFDDGDLASLADEIKNRLAVAARNVDLARLPNIDQGKNLGTPDHGCELCSRFL